MPPNNLHFQSLIFIIISWLICFLFFLLVFQVAALAYAIAFQHPSFWGYLWAILYSVIFDWFLVGIAVASTCRLLIGICLFHYFSLNPRLLILIPFKSSVDSIVAYQLKSFMILSTNIAFSFLSVYLCIYIHRCICVHPILFSYMSTKFLTQLYF